MIMIVSNQPDFIKYLLHSWKVVLMFLLCVCSWPDIRMILNDKTQFEKYEDFMVRRVLAVDPDTRWCPAPDCWYVAKHQMLLHQ